ncbi:cell division protein FtsZ [Alkalicaulis satelles]|uniref:Cell division protein FtsZ n=1 Tax=Alkalicaulis satelles TaxID=2609175 RepID=A0A5M6ZA44_9PROT|nr:cell division protein FtsZ [Alkalicaulis satelles]KAA5801563.1 cell division protein FtsZ [Alkalicaulis satelles]
MPLHLSAPETTELKPRILVFGVGGAGGNAVNNMIDAALEGVDFAVANTDAQALARSRAERRVQMGAGITEGLGAGARPEVGQQAAEDSLAEITEQLQGAHMVFITAGMGGGTGTGAAPVIARAARELNILTVGVVTKPFQFEGSRRMRLAEEGIERLQQHVDTLIIIPNQNLFRIATEKTTFAEAFALADQVLHSGVRGITDLMVMPGLINLDFADVRTVMNEMGKAMMGTGEASGEKRAIEAANNAINNPLLDDVSMKGAKGVLINITGGMDMTLYEVDEAANRIRDEVDEDANIIVGSTFDEALDGVIRVSVVATGIDGEALQQTDPRRRPAEVTPAWKGRETRPVRQAEPMVRRAADAVAVNETPRAVPPAARPVNEPAQPAAVHTAPDTQAAGFESDAGVWDDVPATPADTHADAEPAPRPAVLEAQERLAREITAPRATAPSPAAPAPRDEPRGFMSMFGRRSKPAPAPVRRDPLSSRPADHAPAARPAASVRHAPPAPEPAPAPRGDLFGETLDESELEIPAFLRRQAN